MRPAAPSAADARGRHRGGGDDDFDAASLTNSASATPSLSCLIMSEAELDALGGLPDVNQRYPRKSSVEAGHRSSHLQTQHPDNWLRDPSPTASIFAGLSAPASTMSGVTSPAHSSNSSSVADRDSSVISSTRFPLSSSLHQDAAIDSADGDGPQLIMPSVTLPRRRPFTVAGKSLGRLKVLLAGQKGTGKTSLIQSMARFCEHIVHVDSLASTAPRIATETYASTRPQPWWQVQDHSPSSSQRRLSITEEMLDRNVCFVDCKPSEIDSEALHPESQYVESKLMALLDKSADAADLRTLLSNGEYHTVHAVIYLLHETGPTSSELRHMKQLQRITNIIPVLARADELSVERLAAAKKRLADELVDAGITWFTFEGSDGLEQAQQVLCVSNAATTDHDTIDASVLMSSGYVQPLVKTDLQSLVDNIFSPDGSAWLRHSAAIKGVEWWQQRQGGSLQLALARRRDLGVPMLATAHVGRDQQQDWGRIEVVDWARSLRRSLMVERLDSVSGQDALALLPRSSTLAMTKREQGQSRGQSNGRLAATVHQDPLGLLVMASDVKRTGRLALELLSSIGFIGCVAAWIIQPDWSRCPEFKNMPRWCLLSVQMLGAF